MKYRIVHKPTSHPVPFMAEKWSELGTYWLAMRAFPTEQEARAYCENLTHLSELPETVVAEYNSEIPNLGAPQ